ncbi:MAG TPA: hypothetical protein VJH03_18955 [Blastocatellia bacterium]|nr:hypothetical protein [Blastocatellia bacterium]
MTAGALLAGLILLTLLVGFSASRQGVRPAINCAFKPQEDPGEVPILVTVRPIKGEVMPELRPEDFVVMEDGRRQAILSAKQGSEVPLSLAVLVQDDVVSRAGNEIEGTRRLIKSLPASSRVMTGYITAASLQVTQPFTPDLCRAAASMRIPHSSAAAAPSNPYVELLEAFQWFDSLPRGRSVILLVSDGLDLSQGLRAASPWLSISLERAITEAQRRQVAVFAFYAPSVGLTSVSQLAASYGQGSLNRLACETGGEAFFYGTDFVTFDPSFREFRELLDRQWLITYRSDNPDKGMHRIEVTTNLRDVQLRHQVGYTTR